MTERVRWFLALSAVYLLGLGVAAQTPPADLIAAGAVFERGAWAEAVDAYQAAIDEGVAGPRAWLQIARTQRELGQPGKALAALDAARAFDFWVGDWQVRLADGRLVGENRISKGQGGCIIVEQWQSALGTTGTSLNFYSPERDEWRQVWVGAGGSLNRYQRWPQGWRHASKGDYRDRGAGQQCRFPR